MPEKVELIIEVKGEGAIKNIRDTQRATQDLHNASEKGMRREKGLIEDIEDALDELTKARKKAYKIEDIEKYNQKIAEAKRDLDEYTKAGVKAEKQTESFTKSISKWALGLGGAAAAIKILKDAILATTAGINAFNIAAAVTKQVLHNLVTGAGSLTAGLRDVIAAQKELNRLRLQEKVDTFNAAKQQIVYNKALVDAKDQMNTIQERIKSYDKALEAHGKMIDIEIGSTRDRIKAIEDLMEVSAGDEKLQMEYADLQTKLLQLENKRYSAMKEISSMRSGLLKAESEERKAMFDRWYDEIEQQNKERLDIQKKFQDLSLKLLDDYDKAMIESLQGQAKLEAQRDFALKEIAQFKEEMKKFGEITAEQEKQFELIGMNVMKAFYDGIAEEIKVNDTERFVFPAIVATIESQDIPGIVKRDIQKSREEIDFMLKEYKEVSVWQLLGIDPESDEGKDQIDAMRDAARTIEGILDDTFDRRVEMAERERELLDSRIAEVQRSIDLELQLMEEGYANNVEAKRNELEELKKQREQALRQEEKALKQQQIMESISQNVNLVSSVANLLKSFTKLGPAGLLLVGGAIATLYAIFASAKSKAAEATKLAEGGSGSDTGIVTGRRHSQGGENFLDHVEVEKGEAWGVLSRPATQKYGEVFHDLVSSFNRDEMPQMMPIVNNVNIDNKGSNSRLDRVNNSINRLNNNITRQPQISLHGNKKIIKKGLNMRVIG